MTKQRIEQYINLKREIAMLEEQIHAAENAQECVSDTVKGSTKEAPYTMHSMVIKGYASMHVPPKLYKRKAVLEAECAAVEKYIESVADSAMRQLLVRRYVEGRNLAEVARLAGYSERQTIRLYNGFFAKMSPNVTQCH